MKHTTQTAAKLTVALCGNPNSGKTTLFNALTGSNQKVGNWPGVTVEQKTGKCKFNPQIAVVDTPGIYSLSPFSLDEQVTLNFLLQGKPDVIINVVDCTNLQRSLFLTSQLLELDAPMIVALNMQDEAKAKGITTDTKLLENKFGCKFVEISAAKNTGVQELLHHCTANSRKKNIVFPAHVENAVSETQALLHCANTRWTAIKLLENNGDTEKPSLTVAHRAQIEKTRTSLQQLHGDIALYIAQERHNAVSAIAKQSQNFNNCKTQAFTLSPTERIDKIVLNKWLAFPLFALVMTLIFYLSIDGIGGFFTKLISQHLTPMLQNAVKNSLPANLQWLCSLLCDGIVDGVMSVVSFVPQIMLLFGFIAALEASGYMSRIAFITDRLLSKVGLGGRSFLSLVLGCGCSVPAIMATRTIKNTSERNTTITLTPFMPCSAKLAIISFFTTHLLGGNALFAVSFYFLSILAIILSGLLLKTFSRKKEEDVFVMELPTYRAPKLSNVAKQMWERGKAFILKAGSVILLASVVLWLMQKYNFRFQQVDAQHSMLATVGKMFAPLFYPLGFNDKGYGWQFTVSAFTGIAAKETVVTTLQILLPNNIENCISPLAAYSFVAYNLLTVPCMAAISASISEQGIKKGVAAMAFQFAVAYTVSLLIYNVGTFMIKYETASKTVACCAAIALTVVACVKYLYKHRHCSGCCKNCTQTTCPKQ